MNETIEQLTIKQMSLLRHMLGLPSWVWADEPRKPPYRDYAAMNTGDPDAAALEREGLVRLYRKPDAMSEYNYWTTTDAGKRVAYASVEHRKRSRSARAYDRWLAIADTLGLTFGEYLKSRDPDVVAYRRGLQ